MTLDTEAIEAELAAITQGPIIVQAAHGEYKRLTVRHCPEDVRKEKALTLDDCVFLSNAPAHVRALLARVKELEEALRSVAEASPHIGWDDELRHWVCFDTEESSSCRTCRIVAALNRAESE